MRNRSILQDLVYSVSHTLHTGDSVINARVWKGSLEHICSLALTEDVVSFF